MTNQPADKITNVEAETIQNLQEQLKAQDERYVCTIKDLQNDIEVLIEENTSLRSQLNVTSVLLHIYNNDYDDAIIIERNTTNERLHNLTSVTEQSHIRLLKDADMRRELYEKNANHFSERMMSIKLRQSLIQAHSILSNRGDSS